MELDVSQAGTGTYADEIGFSNTPEDYNDSTFSSGPSNIIGSENITTTYPGTNITDTSRINMDADPMPGGMFGDAFMYNIARGGTATNPYPESIFSKLFGAENVDYTNILGGQGISDVMDLRYNQAIGGRSQNPRTRGQLYQPRDYVVGAPTVMGEVKPMEGGIASFFRNIVPGLSSIVSSPGLPEGDERYQQFLKDQEAGGTTERAGTTDANVLGFNLSDVINSIKAGITSIFDYPKPVQDAINQDPMPGGRPSFISDFEVTRTPQQRPDMLGIASVLPEENRRDMEDNIGFTPFGDEIKLIDRSPSPVKKEVISQNQNQGIGGINEIFKKDLDNLMRSGLSRDAARAVIMDKYGF
tara:strand:+ start:1516 stop:2586 length:1071 start_codon:yes stop_codon:yes gene_type:complete